jgi:hypothetical protein
MSFGSWIERMATNQLSENYKPFLWCRLRAKPFAEISGNTVSFPPVVPLPEIVPNSVCHSKGSLQRHSDLMPAEDKLNLLDRCTG